MTTEYKTGVLFFITHVFSVIRTEE
jgi:hypothetical protein